MKAPISAPEHPSAQAGVTPTESLAHAEGAQGGSGGFDLGDLKHYLHVVVRRIWLVALCFAISVSVSVVMLMKQVPEYSSTARILLGSGLRLPGNLNADDIRQVTRLGGNYIRTQQYIATSKEVVQRAKELMNYPLSEINANILSTQVYPVFQTSMMNVSIKSLDPNIGADYANALAQAYITFTSDERLAQTQETIVGLSLQANRLREELQKAEEKLLTFRRENRIIGISQKENIAENILGTLAARAANFRNERILLEGQQPMLNKAPADVVLSIVGLEPGEAYDATLLSAPNVDAEGRISTEKLLERGVLQQKGWRGYRKQRAILESELGSLREKFRDAHPKVKEKKQALAEVNRKIDIELEFARRQFDAKLESLRIQEESSLRAEKSWEQEALDVSRKALSYENLQKDASRLQRLYDLMFDRLRNLDIQSTVKMDTVRLIEKATPAGGPNAPRKLQNLFLAALVGIGVGLGLIIGLEFIDDSVRYPDEVTRGLGLPFFGIVPSAEWDQDDLSTHLLSNLEQKSGLAEAYRNIRSSLLFSASEDRVQSLAFISALPQEGKTTTSLNMSVSLAQAGSRVLLVDGDMRRGELHKFFGLEGGRGLSDVLAGQAKPESIIQQTMVSNLDLVATGPFPPNPAEIVLRPEFDSFMEYAKRNYDRIILDCPPVMAVSEAAVLASKVDGVVHVVWGGHTSRKIARTAVGILRERGANLMGCVLNNLEFGRVGYYYSGYYGYYGDYYGDDNANEAPRSVI